MLFLEFWKRRQYFLQYDWDVLGFEESEVLTLQIWKYYTVLGLCAVYYTVTLEALFNEELFLNFYYLQNQLRKYIS